MSLQITSMADIFIIVLVFLLKSYSTGAIELTPPSGLVLPTAETGKAAPSDGLQIQVAQDQVRVDGRMVARISDFAFAASDLGEGGSSRALTQALRTMSGATSRKVLVVADQRAPYSTIKTVLASAALGGFTDFKLAVSPAE